MTRLFQTRCLYVDTDAVCYFANWLQFYAFDVIGHITYGKAHGFVERNEDVEGMVGCLWQLFSYVAPVGARGSRMPQCSTDTMQVVHLPTLDVTLRKNPVMRLLDWLDIQAFKFPIVSFAKVRMAERLSGADTAAPAAKRADLLTQLLNAKADHPAFFEDGRVLTMAVSMAFAGSETTATTLAAAFYYLLRTPHALARLCAEVAAAEADGRLAARAEGLVSWSESQTLRYLDAVVKETFRMHPAAGLPLERVVPKGGVEISGRYVPGGTIVGCSAWIIHKTVRGLGRGCRRLPPRALAGRHTGQEEGDGRLLAAVRHGQPHLHRKEHQLA